jgi:putative nucleotidyltransferase with HDIG domain
MLSDIHKRILKYLLVTWVLLALVVGGSVYVVETEKIDDRVLDLAQREAASITPALMRLLDAPPEQQAPLRAKVDELLGGHFAVIELYDRNRRSVVERGSATEPSLALAISRASHHFPLGEQANYQRIRLGKRLFLQVLLPLRMPDGSLAGYFEGVYAVDAATLDKIYADVQQNVGLAIVVTLVTTLILYPVIVRLSRELLYFSNDLLRSNLELIEVLGGAVAKRDSDTNSHNYRVTLYAVRLAEALGLNKKRIRNLIAGAFLHDVGKIGISDTILLKPGRLTAEEFAVMKTHVVLGVDILAKSEWLQNARDVVACHHEKYDGSGYPQGLKGDAIPLDARVFAVVDVFDALTSKRPYKPPLPFDTVMEMLRQERGRHFDPEVLDAFAPIARTLFDEVGSASEAEIEKMMRAAAQHYFFDNTFLAEFLTGYFHRHTTRRNVSTEAAGAGQP